MRYYQFILPTVAILSCSVLAAQNLDKIGKKDMFHTGGGLSYSSVFYNAKGMASRRPPFTWFLSGNFTTSILDISLPFTFNYSNNQLGYTQPYMLECATPTYKWVKGYAGIASMNFSQYTLSSHIFSGVGIELTPKNFKFSAMYGRLKKAVEYDVMNNSDANMSYKRMGAGFLAGYEKKGHGLTFILFTAKDDPTSLVLLPTNTNVTPKQNTVISLAGKTSFFKKIKMEAEYALSGLTRNLSIPQEITPAPKNQLPYVFRPNPTSQFLHAFKTSTGYSSKVWGINLIYERVDPEYNTLGAYYFSNDFENITIAPSFNLLNGKLNLSCNSGIQRNNLNDSKLNTNKRWIGSVNCNYLPNKKWSLAGSYSNFSTFTRQKPQTDPFFQQQLDTVNFYQLSQTALISTVLNFGTNTKKQSLFISSNYNVISQKQGSIMEPGFMGSALQMETPSKVINGNIGYTISYPSNKTSLNTSINSNLSELSGIKILYFGPNFAFSKGFLKNTLRLTAGTSFNEIATASKVASHIFNERFGINYSPKFSNTKAGKISMMVNLSHLYRITTTHTGENSSEFTGNLGINYSF